MSVIVKGGGGSKPEGLYAWKKNNYTVTPESFSTTDDIYISAIAQNEEITYYYSTSYTLDEVTGMFVLDNPTVATLSYNETIGLTNNVYVTVFSPSSQIMFKTCSTSGKTYLYNTSAGVKIHAYSTSYSHTVFKCHYDLTLVCYAVSNKESAYPNGAVHTDGYYYELVGDILTPEMFGCTKMSVDTYIPTSDVTIDEQSIPHSLGVIPRAIIMVADRDTYQFTGDYCQFVFYAIDKDNSAYGIMLRTYPGYNQKYVDRMSGVSSYVTNTNFKWDVLNQQTSSYPASYKSGVTYTIYTFG